MQLLLLFLLHQMAFFVVIKRTYTSEGKLVTPSQVGIELRRRPKTIGATPHLAKKISHW